MEKVYFHLLKFKLHLQADFIFTNIKTLLLRGCYREREGGEREEMCTTLFTLNILRSQILMIPSSPPEAKRCFSLRFQWMTLTSRVCASATVRTFAFVGFCCVFQIRMDRSTEHDANT